jgi:protein TonB
MPPKIAPIVVALVLAACSRGEPETKPGRSASAPLPASPPPSAAEEKAADSAAARSYAPSDALKERLARQEAASKLLDAPPPARAPEPAPKPVAAAKAPPPPAPPPASVKAEPPRPPPVNVAAAPPSPPPAPAKSEPAKPEAAPRTEVALARPAAAPATRLLHRVEPEFPREALKAGVNEGIVQARLVIDAGGNVTRVDVIEAKPRRLFDRAVVRALSDWKYSAGAADRTVEVEIAFSAR